MEIPQWMLPVRDRLEQLPAGTALLVSFPVYRPDLARELAFQMGMEFYDFRLDFMSHRGQSAAQIPLAEMSAQLERRVAEGPVVFHNAEALLACYSEEGRREWLADVLAEEWPQQLVLPLYLFGGLIDAIAGAAPVHIEPELVPEQTLVSRLLNA